MPLVINEKPGAVTPWTGINQLLAPDERFEKRSESSLQYVFAPKHTSQLAALFFALKQQKVAFEISPHATFPVIISARAFSQLCFHDQGVVEVGAGCTLSELNQFLFTLKQEAAVEENPLDSQKQSLCEFLLSGRSSGYRLRRESFQDSLLGIEFVTLAGSQVKWGGMQKGGFAGPALHRLLHGIKSFPGMIVKIFLKTYPLPPRRVCLSWSFDRILSLQNHMHALKNFSLSWEYLDCVISGRQQEKGFIFAQLSGLEEEMEAFSNLCPGYAAATQKGERNHMKKFLQQLPLRAFSSHPDQRLESDEYLWQQEVDSKVWWMTGKDVEEKSPGVWKNRFLKSLADDG